MTGVSETETETAMSESDMLSTGTALSVGAAPRRAPKSPLNTTNHQTPDPDQVHLHLTHHRQARQIPPSPSTDATVQWSAAATKCSPQTRPRSTPSPTTRSPPPPDPRGSRMPPGRPERGLRRRGGGSFLLLRAGLVRRLMGCLLSCVCFLIQLAPLPLYYFTSHSLPSQGSMVWRSVMEYN